MIILEHKSPAGDSVWDTHFLVVESCTNLRFAINYKL